MSDSEPQGQLSLFEVPAPREPEPRRPEELPPAIREEEALRRALNRRLERRLGSLTLTDNRRSILYVRPAEKDPEGLVLRLHRAFLGAPDRVLDAVAEVVGAAKGEQLPEPRELLRRHVAAYWERHGRPPARRRPLEPVGHTLDLEEVRDQLNHRFFEGRLEVEITWSGVAPGAVRRSRSIRLGSWESDTGVVRVHPALDHPEVPRWVVESVVYHELLHADMEPEMRNGRRHVHTAEFRRREKRFPRHAKARRWIRRNLGWLLRY